MRWIVRRLPSGTYRIKVLNKNMYMTQCKRKGKNRGRAMQELYTPLPVAAGMARGTNCVGKINLVFSPGRHENCSKNIVGWFAVVTGCRICFAAAPEKRIRNGHDYFLCFMIVLSDERWYFYPVKHWSLLQLEYLSWHIDALREPKFAHTKSALTKAVSCIASRQGLKPNAFFPLGHGLMPRTDANKGGTV